MPNIAGVALAYLMLTVPQVVMVESFLSFLGLGVQEPLTSLGILVKEGADDMDMAPLGLALPGGLLVVILVCLTMVMPGAIFWTGGTTATGPARRRLTAA